MSDSGDDSSDSDAEEFADGYGDDLIGDEDDRNRLEQMTEMEREQVIFERVERREALKKRWVLTRNPTSLRMRATIFSWNDLYTHSSRRMEIQKRLKNQMKKEKKAANKKKSAESHKDKPMDRRKALDESKKGSKKMSMLEELKAKREEKKKLGKSDK